ncbi:hypothetical protein M0R45_035803 [Rubus argutus]|uniref:Uncharacterized protein n=1 Tax=Rubus argutus TaxID=59490 RepID=A0AAW1VU76_RUBAR
MKEYLRAATSIANEMNKSCHRTCTLAHVSRPVNPTAKMLLGSGSSSRSPHHSSPSHRRRWTQFLLLSLSRLPSPAASTHYCCFASATNLMGLLGIWVWVLKSKEVEEK